MPPRRLGLFPNDGGAPMAGSSGLGWTLGRSRRRGPLLHCKEWRVTMQPVLSIGRRDNSCRHEMADADQGDTMDFELPAEDDPRRSAVRAWLAERPSPTGRELAD